MSCQRDQNNGRDNLMGNDVNFYRIFFKYSSRLHQVPLPRGVRRST